MTGMAGDLVSQWHLEGSSVFLEWGSSRDSLEEEITGIRKEKKKLKKFPGERLIFIHWYIFRQC